MTPTQPGRRNKPPIAPLTILQGPAEDRGRGHTITGAGVGQDADAVVGVLLQVEDVGALSGSLALQFLVCVGGAKKQGG